MNARKLFAVLTALCLMMGVCVLAEENISDEAYVFSVDDVESVVSDAISDDTLISVEEVDQSYSDTSLDLGEEDAENGLDQDVSVTVIVEEGEGEETNPVVDMAVSEDSNENDTAEDGEKIPSTLTDEAGVADGMIESITIEGETQVEDQDASAQTIPLFEGTVQGENHPVSLAGATVTCDPKSYTYDGNQKVPSLTVKLADGTTLASTDYDVSYSPDNVNAGTVTVKVTAKGDYTGEATGTFVINKAERTVTARYTGDVPDKVYDKTRNLPKIFFFKSSDFIFSDVASGDTVSLDSSAKDSSGKTIFSAGYEDVNVGSRKLTITLAIKYKSRNYVYKLGNSTITSEKSGNITPKKLTIRPGVKKKDANGNVVKDSNGKIVVETQTKVYGTDDPSSYSGVVDGILEGDSLAGSFSGKLSREPGENVGNYPITIGTLKTMGNYATDPQLEEGYFEILPKSISDFELDPIPDQQYTGSAVTPDKVIKLKYESKALGTKTLVKGTDFDVKYSNNVEPGTATVTITGKGNYTGTRTESFTILHKPSLLDKGIRISPIGSQKYTGSALEPVITVTYTKEGGDTQTLVEGTDYDVLYDNNIEIGIATVTLVGKGHFTGQRSIFFTIEKDGGSDPSSGAEDLVPNDPAPVPAPAPAAVVAQEPVTIAKVPASTKAKAGKKGRVTVTWKKIKKTKKTKALLGQIKSVQVQYSTDPNFAADVVTKTVSKKKTKLNLKLQKKTTYYIRVRYVGTDGVSDWGAVKKVTTKK